MQNRHTSISDHKNLIILVSLLTCVDKHLSEHTINPIIEPILMTSYDFASHMVCFNKSNFSLAIKVARFRGNFELTSVLRCVYLLVNKVAVLVTRVKSTKCATA